VQEALSRLQENGRYAIDIITRDVREAGFLGCAGRISESKIRMVNTLNQATAFAWNFTLPIQGFQAEDPPPSPDGIKSATAWAPDLDPSILQPLGGRDVLTIRHSVGDPIKVEHHPGGDPPGSADIQVPKNNGLKQDEIVMITDCTDAAVFQISSANPDTSGSLAHNTGVGSPGNATKKFGKDYTGTGEVVRVETVTYFIRTGQNGLPALWRKVGVSDAQEIIEDVQDMQILYGEDPEGDGVVNRYTTADAIANWDKVDSVSVSLLLRTSDNNLTNTAQSFTFNDVTYNDRRLYKVFTETVGIRNKML
jgi:type IV pilus assembly protein PilW